MDIERVKIVYETARYGSLNKAAENLGYTQSGLRYVINCVEKELGFELLKRTNRGVTLTEQGKQLEEHFRKLADDMANFEAIRRGFASGQSRVLRIGCCPVIASHWVPEVIRRCQEKYDLQFKVYAGRSEIIRWLEEGKIDLGIIEKGISGENTWIYLGDEEIYAALPSDAPFVNGESLRLEQLESYHVIMADHDPRSGGMSELKEWAESLGSGHLTIYDTAGAMERLGFVRKGLGITFFSSLYKEELGSDIQIHPLDPPICRKLGIIYPPHATLTENMNLFISEFKLYLEENA